MHTLLHTHCSMHTDPCTLLHALLHAHRFIAATVSSTHAHCSMNTAPCTLLRAHFRCLNELLHAHCSTLKPNAHCLMHCSMHTATCTSLHTNCSMHHTAPCITLLYRHCSAPGTLLRPLLHAHCPCTSLHATPRSMHTAQCIPSFMHTVLHTHCSMHQFSPCTFAPSHTKLHVNCVM
jgi:hypothetical protein